MPDQSEEQDSQREQVFEPDYGIPKVTSDVTDTEKAAMHSYMEEAK
jgi:hypothetical protein